MRKQSNGSMYKFTNAGFEKEQMNHFLKILTLNNAQCNIDCTLLLRLVMNNYHISN